MATGAGRALTRTAETHPGTLAADPAGAQLHGRSRRTLRLRGWPGRDRLHLLDLAALLQRLLARAAVRGACALHLSVRQPGTGFAWPAARRRQRRGTARGDPRLLAGPHRSLQRVAWPRRGPGCAPRRDGPGRRLSPP